MARTDESIKKLGFIYMTNDDFPTINQAKGWVKTRRSNRL